MNKKDFKDFLYIFVSVCIVFFGITLHIYITHTGIFCDEPRLVFNGSFGDIEYYSGCGNCGCPIVFNADGNIRNFTSCLC